MIAGQGVVFLHGRGIVFLHGAGARREVWQLQALAFPQAETPDLPGRDGVSPPQTVADHVAALRPVLEAARVLVGHSLGGAIALHYALAAPARLAGLVLLGTGARLDPAQVWLRRLDAGEDALADLAPQSFAPGAAERLTRKSLAMLRSLDPAVVRADFTAAAGFDVRDRLGGVLVPVLIISGTEDRLVPPRYAEFLHAHLPRATLAWIEGAGHMAMLEQPQAVNGAIRNFLQQVTER